MVLLHTGLGDCVYGYYANRRPTLDLATNSPDLNPVDYGIWGLLRECVYSESIRDLEEFKQRLVNKWAHVKQSVIDKAMEQW